VLAASGSAALRLLGTGLVGLGVVVLAWGVAGASQARTGPLDVVLLVLATIAGALAVVAAARLLGRGPRLILGSDGFENRTSTGVGTRRGRWAEVRELRVEQRVVVLVLDGDRRSVVNPVPLGVSAEALAGVVRPYLGRPLN
jgi:hypothetical protein